ARARSPPARPGLFLFGCFGFYKKPRNFRTKPNTRTTLSGKRRRRPVGCVARAPEKEAKIQNAPTHPGHPARRLLPAPIPSTTPAPAPPGCSGPDPGSGLPTATGNAVRG
ncbi:hypothetical protein H1C71_033387, partial [Ictidomys tridecemlineatus]